jgi:Tol biopolymer transport system component
VGDTFGEWSPDGKRCTTDPIQLSDYPSRGDEGSCLIELGALNSSSVWKNLPVKKIIKSKEPNAVSQSTEPNLTNTSQVAENKQTSRQSPSFMFLHLFTCIMGIWLLRKSRELRYCE